MRLVISSSSNTESKLSYMAGLNMGRINYCLGGFSLLLAISKQVKKTQNT